MVDREVRIGDVPIGPGSAPYLIAEGGVNHNGSPALAHDLVDMAADCGANAVKFQTYEPASLATKTASTAEYQRRETGASSQLEMLSSLCLPLESLSELHSHARDREIEFLSTPFDVSSLNHLIELGVKAIKISSGDISNYQLLRAAGAVGLPVILSTGASYFDEVAPAVEALGGPADLILLHCVTSYPAPVDQSNLRSLLTLSDAFLCPVGWSDHSIGIVSAVTAVGLGATVFEKHITTDSSLPGPDHRASAEPDAFAEYVTAIREAEAALGDGKKAPQPAEEANRRIARRGLYASADLPKGTVLDEAHFRYLRPEAGLPASTPLNGRVLLADLSEGDALQPEHLGAV